MKYIKTTNKYHIIENKLEGTAIEAIANVALLFQLYGHSLFLTTMYWIGLNQLCQSERTHVDTLIRDHSAVLSRYRET